MEEKLYKILKSLKMHETSVSTFIGALAVIVIGFFIFGYFKNINRGRITQSAVVEVTPPVEVTSLGNATEKKQNVLVPGELPESYKVSRGDNLWKIAEKVYGSGYNFVDIAKENNIKDANSIEVGMELKIPKVAARNPTATNIAVDDNNLVASKTNQGKVTIESDKYTTQKGDYLWDIAIRSYGDGYAWVKIYQANREKIGANPGVLYSGIELVIPRK